MVSNEELSHRFGFHKATIEGPNATSYTHAEMRTMFLEWADFLNHILPDGREKDLALEYLETASMWSHKSVARRAPLDPHHDIFVSSPESTSPDYVEPQHKCAYDRLYCSGKIANRKLGCEDGKELYLCEAHFGYFSNPIILTQHEVYEERDTAE